MTKKKEITKSGLYMQYALIGGALGLYYGIRRPPGEADFFSAIWLSVLAALVTVIFRSWKKGFPFAKIAKDFLISLSFFLIFMLSLAFRKIAFDLGGQTIVIIEMMLVGVCLGLLMAWQRIGESETKNE